MVAFYLDVLRLLDVVHALEDGEAVSHTVDAHALEVVVQQRYQRLADDFIFCRQSEQPVHVAAHGPLQVQTNL